MRLELLSYEHTATYFQKNDTVILSLGSTEQHSPDGIIGTDYLITAALAERCGEDLGLLSTPVLPYGVALHHMGFSGTVTLKPTTLILLLEDIIRSLYHHGARRFFMINGHGGNIHTVMAAFSQICADLRIATEIANWWHLPEVVQKEQELFGAENGQHATVSEISVTRYLYPEAFTDWKTRPPQDYSLHKPAISWPIHRDGFQKNFPLGSMASNPSKADADSGAIIFELTVATINNLITKFMLKDY